MTRKNSIVLMWMILKQISSVIFNFLILNKLNMKNFLTSILLLVIIFWVLHNFLDFSVKDIPKYFERLGKSKI